MTGYDFHSEAEIDLDEIWDYIAAENVNASTEAPFAADAMRTLA